MHNNDKNDLAIYQMIVSKVTYRTLISAIQLKQPVVKYLDQVYNPLYSFASSNTPCLLTGRLDNWSNQRSVSHYDI